MLVERSGARTGLITTRGFGDTIFIQRLQGFTAGVPDQFEIIYQGIVILNTGSVSGSQTHVVTFGPGTSTNITVRVTGPSGTQWTYTVSCPT